MKPSIRDTDQEILRTMGVQIPRILLPKKDVPLDTWAVVACDQYTSDQAYWTSVEELCRDKPSTLHLTLPEIYLKAPDLEERITTIVENMESYLDRGLLEDQGASVVYIERRTHSGLRQGLVLALDLEKYDFARDSRTLIRATEGTIQDRIPPRLRIRSRAILELPHIMVLVDDPAGRVVEGFQALAQGDPSYATGLCKDGGDIKGWVIPDHEAAPLLAGSLAGLHQETVAKQGTDTPLLFAMGDGNHSLATAKTNWERIKDEARKNGTAAANLENHPARYALVELVNIHSAGLHFEPIHRAVFTGKPEGYLAALRARPEVVSERECDEATVREALENTKEGQDQLAYYDGKRWILLSLDPSRGLMPPAVADLAHEDFIKTHGEADIDFIHGWEDVKALTGHPAAAILLPVIRRDRLFSQVAAHGPLPRKAFSMGEAEEKRYYFEARRIIL